MCTDLTLLRAALLSRANGEGNTPTDFLEHLDLRSLQIPAMASRLTDSPFSLVCPSQLIASFVESIVLILVHAGPEPVLGHARAGA